MIGSALVGRLDGLGQRVTAAVHQPASAVPAGIPAQVLDVADPGAVARLVDEVRPEVIYHLAGVVVGARDLSLVRATVDANLLGTINVLDAASKVGTGRVVVLGSLLQHPDDSDSLAAPASPYEASKWAATMYARMYHSLGGVDAVIVRPSMVYGGGYTTHEKVVSYVIRTLLRGERPRLSSGRWEIDWLFLDDAVDGLIAAGTVQGVGGMTVDLGSGQVASVREVVERICRLMATDIKPDFGAVADRPREAIRWADTQRTKQLLGWEARTDLDDGLRRTIEWYARSEPRIDSSSGSLVAEGR
jgi:UDP-glucose 4-epimerase